MRLAKFTRANDLGDVWVNPDHVAFALESGALTQIHFHGNTWVAVTESLEEATDHLVATAKTWT